MIKRLASTIICFCASALWGQSFQHPGVLLSRSQLDFVKAEVNAQHEPMYSAFQKAVASKYGALNYRPLGPPADGNIQCGSNSNPDIGCTYQDKDSKTAYVQSLLWYITGNQTYANNAIAILNAYGHNLKQYTNSNAPLEAAWGAELWPRTAEILRYSNAGWQQSDIDLFTQMLTGVILPLIRNGSGSNGNWELSMVEAMFGIAVFTDDHVLFDQAQTMWNQRIPAYIYIEELDGPHPNPVPRGAAYTHWYGSTDLDSTVDGITQETCRDLNHTSLGLAAAINSAETVHIQGGTLYEENQQRLLAAIEFDTTLLLQKEPVSPLVCGGNVNYIGSSNTFVVGYNEYHNRLGFYLPNTQEWITQHVEAAAIPGDLYMMVFEPLTHGANAPQ